MKSNEIHIRAISQEMPQPSVTKICLKITYLKFHSNFPGANELSVENSVSVWCVGFYQFDYSSAKVSEKPTKMKSYIMFRKNVPVI